MKLRVARHTTNLDALIAFYCDIAGFDLPGSFRGHEGYDVIFIGQKGDDWNLEFTVSDTIPDHRPDDDDLLVFYVQREDGLNAVREQFREKGIAAFEPKNLYWSSHGVFYKDPDGYGVLFAVSS